MLLDLDKWYCKHCSGLVKDLQDFVEKLSKIHQHVKDNSTKFNNKMFTIVLNWTFVVGLQFEQLISLVRILSCRLQKSSTH